MIDFVDDRQIQLAGSSRQHQPREYVFEPGLGEIELRAVDLFLCVQDVYHAACAGFVTTLHRYQRIRGGLHRYFQRTDPFRPAHDTLILARYFDGDALARGGQFRACTIPVMAGLVNLRARQSTREK